MPLHPSPRTGPEGLRARVGFSPKRPHAEAGMRIDPPPSVAWAAGRTRAATAAAEPPDEPPALWAVFQGLCVGPVSTGSVEALMPNSGVVVRARTTSPAAR